MDFLCVLIVRYCSRTTLLLVAVILERSISLYSRRYASRPSFFMGSSRSRSYRPLSTLRLWIVILAETPESSALSNSE